MVLGANINDKRGRQFPVLIMISGCGPKFHSVLARSDEITVYDKNIVIKSMSLFAII